MTVHFVCSGNTYRSRLAEAYLNSKKLKGIEVISSGINASENGNRPISWLTQRLFEVYKLVPFEKPNWDQTTKKLLETAELTIFFGREYYEHCVKEYGFSSKRFEIWDIKDLDRNIADHMEKIRVTEETFKLIKQKVDDLADFLVI